MKCPDCGKFMRMGEEIDDPLEDEVVRWWFCKCEVEYPEHIYFKSSLKHRRNAEGEKVCNEDCANCPVRYECPDSSYEYSIEETKKRTTP